MKSRITMITIGVDDLERSLRFYRDGLGLPTEGFIGKEFEYGAVAFFDLQAGLKLAIWPRKSLLPAIRASRWVARAQPSFRSGTTLLSGRKSMRSWSRREPQAR